MGESSHTVKDSDEFESGGGASNALRIESSSSKSKKLKFVPLILLIYFEVSDGPFGEEPAVKAAGPLLALLGFVIFPFVWSIPEALVTAKLATAYPGNGGYVVWAWAAFGPFWGFLMGWWKWISGVINNAAYLALCVDYLRIIFTAFNGGPVRIVCILFYTVSLSYLNFRGLSIVGWTVVTLGLISLAPFALLFFFSIPKLKPSRWRVSPQGHMDWSLFFYTLFWSLNFWDNASTLAGEVENLQRTFPKALFCVGILASLGYILPLMAAMVALELNRGFWNDGYLAVAASWLLDRGLNTGSSWGLFYPQSGFLKLS